MAGEYSDHSPAKLFQEGQLRAFPTSPQSEARAWIDAENISAVFAVLLEWYEMMEDGRAEMQYPDPDWQRKPLTEELINSLIAEIDDDFGLERNRFPESGLGPEYSRLSSHARFALVQAICRVLKSAAEIEAEAASRLAKGEVFPPPPVSEGATPC